jgi:hypothetical protein
MSFKEWVAAALTKHYQPQRSANSSVIKVPNEGLTVKKVPNEGLTAAATRSI